ncbi:serine hydrolase domain-containing protein [Arthrobacter sp. RHLT1-20]
MIAIPALMWLSSLRGGSYIDNSWTAVMTAVVLPLVYAASRRLLITVLVAALIVGATGAALKPTLAAERNGDAMVLADLDAGHGLILGAGFGDLSVALVSLDVPKTVRFAGLGSDETTPMEVGSLTKAMTGLVIAESVTRGELRMESPVSSYLPQLAGSPAGTVTIRELVTHTSGYAEFGAAALRRGALAAPFGRTFLGTDLAGLMEEAREGTLVTRGRYLYSTLGAAIAGQAAAAAAGISYPDLMHTRLFAPLGMTDTAIQSRSPLAPGGRSKSGLPVEPWVLGAYAPGGGAVSTAKDLAKFAAALLEGTAPGATALEPTTPTSDPGMFVGGFWHTSVEPAGPAITWHGGLTGGYSSYLGLDRTGRKAVIILSEVGNEAVNDLGADLLTTDN